MADAEARRGRSTCDRRNRCPLDYRRPGMRWRYDRHDRGHPAQHRRHRDAAPCPGFPKSTSSILSSRSKTATSSCERFHLAAQDKLGPFILVIEGSIPDETNKEEGYWASFGTDPKTGQPITTCEWIDRLAPRAWAVIAAGTCATYGGIHAMEGNPTGCMGLADYLGWQWRSKADIPIVCVPGCPVQPDNFMETLLYLLHMAAGRAPMIPLDEALRPTWLFGSTVHEGCDRGGYYEQAQFADEYGSPLCIVKLGCWGPVVQCNVGKRGWMGGIGGCPNIGGICIGCTMPGFPDKFMPFMNQPPGSLLSSAAVQTYGRAIHALRRFTQSSLNKEPGWRKRPVSLNVWVGLRRGSDTLVRRFWGWCWWWTLPWRLLSCQLQRSWSS